MWIRTGNVICSTDEFFKFYIQDMGNGYYGVFGKCSDSTATLLGEYRSLVNATNAFNGFYSALERSDKAHMMQESDKRW
jgi:hypothetical protein